MVRDLPPPLERETRTVYDGGGISPDIQIEAENYARITQELVLRDLCFDFVNSYAST